MDELRREALALSDSERADLAAELLVSLEAPIDDDPAVVQSLWGAEIERRARWVIGGDAATGTSFANGSIEWSSRDSGQAVMEE